MNSKRTNTLILTFLLSLLTWVSAAQGASPVQQLTQDIGAKKSGLWGLDFSAGYRVGSDFNKPERPRTYNHYIDFSVSKTFWEKYSAFAEFDLVYKTLGTDVYRTNPNDPYFEIGDAGLGVMRSFNLIAPLDLSLVATQDILISQESRFAGYRSVTSGMAVLDAKVNRWLKVKNSNTFGYIWNRYKYTPVDTSDRRRGAINPDAFYGFSIGPVFRILPGLNFSPTMSWRTTHFLDNSLQYGFGNAFSLSYSRSFWSVYGRYINRGYADRGETNLWFADEYRRLAQFGVTVNF